MLQNLDKISLRAVKTFFVCFFIVGCFIFFDYGIYWDEGVQWSQVGYLNYQAMFNGQMDALMANFHKYYGPAFEIVLFIPEELFNIKDEHLIFLIRHFICFLTFYAAVLSFYFLCLKIFKNRLVALLACLILVLSPRIFEDAFYNSKDLSMMCFCIISTYTMYLFVEKQNMLTAFFHALTSAFVIDIRIMSVLIPIATVYFFFLQKEKKLVPLLIYIVYTLFFVVLFWPAMWNNPMQNFIEAFKQMSNYEVMDSTNLYNGQKVLAANLPWHYIPVWIGITTPIVYSVLFVVGCIFLLSKAFINFKETLNMHPVVFVLFAPVFAVLFFNSTLYDGWRHIFFIYPYFVIVAVYGFYSLIQVIRNKLYFKTLIGSVVLCLIYIVFKMISLHPYENVYFNKLAGNNLRERFEMDYWGLSYKQCLEYIAENDKSPEIKICSANLPGYLNMYMLEKKDRDRFKIEMDLNKANYFITNFRNCTKYSYQNSYFQIMAGDEKIMEAYKLR